MSKHTNGPWFVGRQIGSNATAIIGDGDSVICTIDGRHGSLAKADANLIAAAPELLQALEVAVRILKNDGYIPSMNMESAIAKARGEA